MSLSKFEEGGENYSDIRPTEILGSKVLAETPCIPRIICLYMVIIIYCPIAVGVENPHKFGMCR
jgi:hypothetical protein